MNSESTGQATTHPEDLARILAEPYAFALVTWPAVVGLLAPLPEAWSAWLMGGLGLWLGAMQLAAYSRGAGFGNVMLATSAVVALACLSHPSPWALAWLPALLIGLNAAQRVRLGSPGRSSARPDAGLEKA
ncbi:MAG: hypothetical protein PHR30_13270 [Gallionellaceae bacterium]|nr:hypothetical protein [Gallionellaceae bacterium]